MSPSKSQAKRQISFLNDQPKTTPQKLNAIVKAARNLTAILDIEKIGQRSMQCGKKVLM